MKEKLRKVADLLGEVPKAVTDGNKETTIAKLAEATDALEQAIAEADKAPVEQPKNEPQPEELAKYASLVVDSDSFKSLLADMKTVIDAVTGLTTVQKTLEEKLEKATTTATTSKQAEEELKKTANPLAGLVKRLA